MLEIKRPKVFASNVATYYVEYKTHINHQRKFQTNPTINKTQSYAKSHSRTIIIFSIQQIKLADVNVI